MASNKKPALIKTPVNDKKRPRVSSSPDVQGGKDTQEEELAPKLMREIIREEMKEMKTDILSVK